MRISYYYGAPRRFDSGIQYYGKQLIKTFIRQYPEEEISVIYNVSRYSLSHGYPFVDRDLCQLPYLLPEKFAHKLWSRVDFPPITLFTGSSDIVHSLTSFMPPITSAKKVITVHDMICFTHPDMILVKEDWVRLMKKTIPQADLIIADSNNTKKDIIEILHIPDSLVNVVYPGVDPLFRKSLDPLYGQLVRKKYRLKYPYFLYAGNLDPRKNIKTMIDAFNEITNKHHREERLVLIGAKTNLSDEILSYMRSHNIASRIIYLGFIPRGDMPAIYSGASAFLYPSFYEGFGFPVLEAMACGTPVICSSTSSLPELAGDAALYVDPGSRDSIVQQIEKLLDDDELRIVLVKKGRKRIELFKWEKTCMEILQNYRRLLEMK